MSALAYQVIEAGDDDAGRPFVRLVLDGSTRESVLFLPDRDHAAFFMRRLYETVQIDVRPPAQPSHASALATAIEAWRALSEDQREEVYMECSCASAGEEAAIAILRAAAGGK